MKKPHWKVVSNFDFWHSAESFSADEFRLSKLLEKEKGYEQSRN